ncbi:MULTISPECIES: RagB/SusD family nutrient uptake outer membrane protein [Niastella]|uniref:RagB/SusD family nutrient uptake outer membrane protein n=1 Tax=Niastella soli TaxID=2821487 RepID=A0ABS3YNE6_9BACT|nr:RagB/SusD family nutrient uptake outer membrane protein [Niastella soli]MBO9198955.1 RagB/SusD family nutrient uptake outer membrane protein [Niastella soli]
MKNIRVKHKWALAGTTLGAVMLLIACSKSFLDKKPLGAFNEDQLLNEAGIGGLLVGAYHMVSGQGGAAGNSWGSAASNWAFGSVAGGDSYKGSTPSDQGDIVPIETWAYNANNPYFNQKWQAVYDGAQRANDVIRFLAKAPSVSDTGRKSMTAEARFLRAHFHFEAKKMWNNVPYVDESISVANKNTNVPNIDESGKFVDIWPKIEADFQFAIDNLPDEQPQIGRANKSAAIAYLGKVLLYQQKFAQAKAQFDKLIPAAYGGSGNGKTAGGLTYKLVNFQDNFNAATDNSAESIFAYQASVNDGSGTNGNYGDVLNFPNSAGPGGCCGFNNPSISLANSYKTDANGLPLFDTYNAAPNVSDPATPYTGTLDPRIDLTMGRPGISFLDWGPTPANTWIRDPGTNGYFSPRKNVYAKSQQNVLSSTETSFWGPTQMDANNVNLIRFADVLLWAAECEMEVGSAEKARAYVNFVRTRAADKTGWVYASNDYDASTGKYKTQTTPADNYKIGLYPTGAFSDKAYALKAIRFERKLELAMEGQRFFDLARWDNNTGTVMAPELNAFAAMEKQRPTIYAINTSATFTAKKNEYFPIPQTQIDIANSTGKINLKQNIGY